MSSREKKRSDKGQEEKKHEEGMQNRTAQKKETGNSSKDKAASSIKSEPTVPPKSKQSGEDKGDQTMTEGEWMKDHPWEGRSPNDKEELKMASLIGKSTVYTLTDEWCTKGNVDLEKIYSNLPNFIEEMKGQSCREDLEWLMKQKMALTDKENDSLYSSTHPHILEIVQEEKGVKFKDEASPVIEKQTLKAFSSKYPKEPNKANYCHLDCEYMLNMYLPESFKEWFNIEDGKRIRSIKPQKKDQRWIFVPSFRRAKIALMKWPGDDDQDEEEDENEDDGYKYDDFDNDDVDDDGHNDCDHDGDIITEDSTIRILVVRPFEFVKYVTNHGHRFPVISLPQEEIGAGYARFWIQKIALRLKLQFIWMIDDSVECFYEYNPENRPKSYIKQNRRRPFELVFERIEMLVKESKHPIAAMSPKRFRLFRGPLKNPFVCSPPRIAVYLNLQLLKKKGVYYRPELQVFEDMIFGYECKQNGLNVFMDNRILLQDHKWGKTGARSLSVKQKMPTKLTKAIVGAKSQ